MNIFVFLVVIAICGTRTSSLNTDVENRIAGGSPAGDTQFRYMISVQQLSQINNYTRGHRCGGALVTLRHAVTSSQCIHERNGAVIIPAQYRVFAGAAALTNDASADRHRPIERFTIHPNHTFGRMFENDIAIITLASAFPSNAVSTVPLSATDATPEQGAVCHTSGWGSQNRTSTVSTQLMYTTKAVLDSTACQKFFTGIIGLGGINLPIIDSMICAMPTTMTYSCEGDLGNPLVCNGNLHGILIATELDCSNTNLGLRPDVYTRISTYRSWIEATTAGASNFQPGMAVIALISIVQFLTAKVLK